MKKFAMNHGQSDPNDTSNSGSSDFALTCEETREERKTDLVFEELSISCAKPSKRTLSLKRTGPRVIGTKIEKKKESKQEIAGNRFAKKKPAVVVSPKKETVEAEHFSSSQSESGVGESSAFAFIDEKENEEEETPFFLAETETVPVPVQESVSNGSESDVVVDVATNNDQVVSRSFEEIKKGVAEMTKAVGEAKAKGDEDTCKSAQIKLLKLLDQAMSMTYNMEDMFKEEQEVAKKTLPAVEKEKELLNGKLGEMRIAQMKYEMALETARRNSAASVQAVRRVVEMHKAQYQEKIESLETRMSSATDPFTSRLAEIEQEKDEHQRAIDEMLKEIERRKRAIQELDQECADKSRVLDQTTQSFMEEQKKLELENKQLALEEQRCDRKVKEIEAPYQSLLDSIEARKKEVKVLEHKVSKTSQLISDFEKDTSQSAYATLIVKKLSASHNKMCQRRVELKENYEKALVHLDEVERELNPKANEQREIKTQATKLGESVKVMRQKLGQLEVDKKSAIAAKNFSAAKTITNQMKVLQEQLASQEQSLTGLTAALESLTSENSQAHAAMQAAKDEIEDLQYEMLANDFNFYESTIAILDGLFELSPYGSRLLSPLQSLMLSALAYIEAPPQPDKQAIQRKIDSLNTRLEIVVNEENYEEAAIIQEQIDRLTSKLTK